MKSPSCAVALVADGLVERDGLPCVLLDLQHLLGCDVHLLGQLLRSGLAAQVLEQLALDAAELVDDLDHVHRDADGAGLVGHRAGDGLPDPPGRVRRELVALGVVELLDRPDQAEVALLDQVQERHPAAGVALGQRDDQSQVRLEQVVLRALAVADDPQQVAAQLRGQLVGLLAGEAGVLHPAQPLGRVEPGLDPLGQVDLLLGVEQGDLADLFQVRPDRVGGGGELGVLAGLPQRLGLLVLLVPGEVLGVGLLDGGRAGGGQLGRLVDRQRALGRLLAVGGRGRRGARGARSARTRAGSGRGGRCGGRGLPPPPGRSGAVAWAVSPAGASAAGSGTACSAAPSCAAARDRVDSEPGRVDERAPVLFVTVLRDGAAAAAVRAGLPRPDGAEGASSMTVTPESLSVRSTRLPCEAGRPASSKARLMSFARRNPWWRPRETRCSARSRVGSDPPAAVLSVRGSAATNALSRTVPSGEEAARRELPGTGRRLGWGAGRSPVRVVVRRPHLGPSTPPGAGRPCPCPCQCNFAPAADVARTTQVGWEHAAERRRTAANRTEQQWPRRLSRARWRACWSST